MADDTKMLMAKSGLVQWLRACIQTGEALSQIFAAAPTSGSGTTAFQDWVLDSHTHGHFFAIAAAHVLEYRNWCNGLELLAGVKFTEIDQFSAKDIIDLRNMREHVIDYFKGKGRTNERWFKETPEYKADASSVVGTMIGGRLDYAAFGEACKSVLPRVVAAFNQ